MVTYYGIMVLFLRSPIMVLWYYFSGHLLWYYGIISQVTYYGIMVSLRKSDRKTCITALNPEIFYLTFFTWWPEMILTYIMVTKHRK